MPLPDLFGPLKEILRFVNDRNDRLNSRDYVNATKARIQERARAKYREMVRNRDLDALNRQLG